MTYRIPNIIFIPLLFLFSLLALTCKDRGTSPRTPLIQLMTEDVEVTEAWVRIQVSPALPHNKIVLKRNGTTILTFRYEGTDTVLYDYDLLPNQTYTYKASAFIDSTLLDVSDDLKISTLVPTGGNFTWEITTLGNAPGHGFSDLAIVNDTCAWAVGEIYNYDSVGHIDPKPYSIAKWNGKNWELMKLYYNINSPMGWIRGIRILGPNDIWLAGGSIFHWDGVSLQTQLSFSRLSLPDPNGTIEKIWGSSSSALYGVGNAGTMVFYNGSSWQQLQSNTALDITDIYGAKNEKTGEVEIMAVASQSYLNNKRQILKISGTTVTTLPDSGLISPRYRDSASVTGVWFVPDRKYYVSGDGIFTNLNPYNSSAWTTDLGSYFSVYYETAIRGNSLRDIVVAGDAGVILHFDGLRWQSYYPVTHLDYGNYYSIAIKGNIVIAVGKNEQLGVIALGRRN